MTLHEIDTIWIILGFLAVAVIIFLIVNRNVNDPLQDKLNKLKFALILGGIFLIAMYIIMPQLSAFDVPYEATDVDSPEEVLEYLQKQNEALGKLTDITRWTLFITVLWVFTAGYNFLNAFGDHLKKEKSGYNNERNS